MMTTVSTRLRLHHQSGCPLYAMRKSKQRCLISTAQHPNRRLASRSRSTALPCHLHTPPDSRSLHLPRMSVMVHNLLSPRAIPMRERLVVHTTVARCHVRQQRRAMIQHTMDLLRTTHDTDKVRQCSRPEHPLPSNRRSGGH